MTILLASYFFYSRHIQIVYLIFGIQLQTFGQPNLLALTIGLKSRMRLRICIKNSGWILRWSPGRFEVTQRARARNQISTWHVDATRRKRSNGVPNGKTIIFTVGLPPTLFARANGDPRRCHRSCWRRKFHGFAISRSNFPAVNVCTHRRAQRTIKHNASSSVFFAFYSLIVDREIPTPIRTRRNSEILRKLDLFLLCIWTSLERSLLCFETLGWD